MGAIKTAADAAWRDYAIDGVSTSGPHEPRKSDIRAVLAQIETGIAASAEGVVVAATWSDLAAIAGARAAQAGRVATTDTGAHTDPVVGVSVANAGEYAWSTSPAGWRRIGDVIDAAALSSKSADALRAANAAVSDRTTQIIGAAAPSVGSNAAVGTYVVAREAAGVGVVRTASVASAVAGLIEIGVFDRSGDTFARLSSIARRVSPGVQTLDIGLPIAQGQYVGVTAPGAGLITYASRTNVGYYSGDLAAEAFVDASAATSLELQLQFALAVSGPRAETALYASQLLAQTVGARAAPVAGANASPGSYVLAEPAASDAVVDTIEIMAGATAIVEIGVYERIDATLTRVASLARVNVEAGALNTFSPGVVLRAGQYLGFQSSAGGWAQYTATAGTGYYFNATTSGSSFDVGAVATAVRLEIRASLRRIETATRHRVGLANSDRVLLVGPSYAAGHYNPAGKNWISKAAAWTDYVVENFGFSGETVALLLDRMRANAVSAYAPVAPRAMNCAYVIICEGYNSANHATNKVAFAAWLEKLRQAAETVRGMGATPVIATEWRPVYERAAHAAVRAVADESGAILLDLVPHSERMQAGAPYADFWRPPNAEMHPGVRANHLIADQVARFFESLPRPRQALKLYRRRGSATVASIDDLMYRDSFERGSKWRGLLVNQISMPAASEKYLDRLTANAADYTVSTVTQSEALLLQNGGSIALGDYALVEIVLDADARNVERARLTLSDAGVTVYIRDAFVSPYPADGASVCRWAALTGAAGVYDLDKAALAGRIHGDKLALLLVKAGGMTLKEPVFEWWGKAGKTFAAALPAPAPAVGGELLRATSAAALTGDTWTGWAASGGVIAPSTDATYQLPAGAAGFAEVDATRALAQSLNYAPEEDDVEAEIVVTARNFPALVDPATYPAGAAITGETWDYRRLRVDLRDPDGALALSYTGRVGLWWDEVRLRTILPLRAGPMDIAISGPDGAVQVASASVKPVRRSLAAHGLRAETTALVARMTVAPSAARAAAYDRLVRALIAAGVWARLDALYILAAHDAQAARLNWRAAAYDLTAVGGMTFAPQRGYQGDGSTGYLSSGFNPTTAQAPLFAQNDAHMGLWSLTDGVAAAHDMGAGNSSLAMLATTTTFQARGNSGAASGTSSTGLGHLMWSRADASNVARYRDGAAHSTTAQASVAPSNYAFRVGGYLTSTASYSARQIAAAHWGAALDATQTEALYNALRRYLTGAGAL